MNKHPGHIAMVDEARGTEERVDAATVPPSVAFVGDVPVLRVVHSKRGDDHVIRSYGPDGALLSTTIGR